MKSFRFIRLSSSYFFYFSVLGLIVPFLTIFLDGKGFSSLEIGEITGLFLTTKIIGPSLWAYIADKTGQQLHIIRAGSFFSLFFFSLLFLIESYWFTVFVLASFGLFWTAMLPQLEVMTLNSVKHQLKVYARIRVWGCIGFILIAVIGGEVIERFSSDAFTYIGVAILTGLFASTLVNRQPKVRASHMQRLTAISSKIINKSFLLFLIASVLLQVSFGPYYTFFGLYLQQLNYSGAIIGLFISLGVAAEIVIFFYVGKIFKRISIKTTLVLALLITAVRWFIIGYVAENFYYLVVAQLMHAASFGLYHSASMVYLHRHFDDNQQSRGQAIYISCVYGAGGALGAYLSGVLWHDGLGATQAFFYAAIASLLASAFVFFLPKQYRKTSKG